MIIFKKKSTRIKTSSNKNFGITFSIFFFILFIYFYYFQNNFLVSLIFTSVIFLIISIIKPEIFLIFNIFWTKLGLFLGKITSPIIMGIIFFFVVAPTGFVMRNFSKNNFYKKHNKKINTYWHKKEINKSTMKNQF